MQLFVFYNLLLFFSIQCLCDSHLLVEELGVDYDRNALECLEIVTSVRYSAIYDFSVIFDGIDAVDDNFFQRFPNKRWKLHSVKNNNFTGYSNVIFFTSDFDSFTATMSAIDIRRMDCRAQIVISVAKNFASLDEIKRASKGIPAAMWKLDKTHVVFLVPCMKYIFAMTYFPFAENCQVGELEILDVWNGNDFVNGAELFPEKMLDIRGCVQRHAVALPAGTIVHLKPELTETGEMILGGVGGRLITIVIQKMNMKLNTVFQPPETWPQLRDQVARGESLFALTGNTPSVNHSEVLDLDSGYMEESFGFGYNDTGFEISWKNLVWPLSREVWQYTGYVGLLFCGLLLMANRCHRSEITSDKFRFLHGFGIFLGTAQALPQSYFGRYLFGMWIVYSYLLNVAYNSGLVSFLTTLNEGGVMNTLEDLLADGIDFGGSTIHREFYHDPSDPVMSKIYNNFKIWSENECVHRIMNRQGVTGLMKSYILMYNSNQTGTGNYRLRLLNDRTITFNVPISMRRGSPFTLGVRRYTSRALQGGFHVYWLKYYTDTLRSTGIRPNTPTTISLQHIKGIMYLHIAGLTLSCVVFLGELMFHKYFRNRRFS